ncbi:MAG: biliverdin-producing heme oxygenase [Weeksellaceae bacterium]|nr:biliverdin-producing heme oxygenase [Weeksellaceae bacterium]
MIADFLKQETKNLHDLLESKMLVEHIMARSLSRQQFGHILQTHFVVHQHIEPKIKAMFSGELQERLKWDARAKTPLLQQELIENQLSQPDPIDFETHINNTDQALGAMYVLEGATLGGQIIQRSLRMNSNFAENKFPYYNIYGGDTGQKWKEFLGILEENTQIPKDVLNGAEQVYSIYLKATDVFVEAK